ncbi:SSI family serine proteinase inhibitor [Streptomyces sp. NPDC059680]|uniref:SSI family serine proteinase inhibitor n=1 Tax=Streptomyces sp. NPDC059680 TaxID=3346904 RepID=UPI00369E6826
MRTYAIAIASAAAVAAALLPSVAEAADKPCANVEGCHLTVLVLTKAHAGFNPAPPPDNAALLGCNPTWGWHPQAGEACATLNSVKGQFEKINVNPHAMCPMIWNPVTVTAQGWWNGRKVSYEKTFTNSCVLERTTDAVFAF